MMRTFLNCMMQSSIKVILKLIFNLITFNKICKISIDFTENYSIYGNENDTVESSSKYALVPVRSHALSTSLKVKKPSTVVSGALFERTGINKTDFELARPLATSTTSRIDKPTTAVSGALLDLPEKDEMASLSKWGVRKMNRSLVDLQGNALQKSPENKPTPTETSGSTSSEDAVSGKIEEVLAYLKGLELKIDIIEEKLQLVVDSFYPDE